jgi:hypothetical protein
MMGGGIEEGIGEEVATGGVEDISGEASLVSASLTPAG